MGRQDRLFIEITDMNTGAKFKQHLMDCRVYYGTILDLIESYTPEIDLQSLTVYYWKNGKWQFFLEDDQEDLGQNFFYFQTHQNSNEIVLQVRYHCDYFLQNQQDEIIGQDLMNMKEKVAIVQKKYQQLRENYIQQALDINVFWGSPAFTEDKISRKGAQFFQSKRGQGKRLQTLNNYVKYIPYVNAVMEALKKSNKKTHLYLKQLNEDSFKKKPIFTVTYIIAHVEVEEVKEKIPSQKGNKNFSKTTYSKFSNSQNTKNSQMKKREYPNNIDFTQQYATPKLSKQSSYQRGDDMEIIMEQNILSKTINSAQKLQQHTSEQDVNFKVNHTKSMMDFKKEKYGTSLQGYQNQDNADNIDDQRQQNLDLYSGQPYQRVQSQRKQKKDYKPRGHQDQRNKNSKRTKVKAYFLGERSDGSLCKITPQKLEWMLMSNPKIDLLILHSSYPEHHLNIFKKHAKNIILINSNPLYPEPSTIYFMKQFFTHLLQTGNISKSYDNGIMGLNTLRGASLQPNNWFSQNEYDEAEVRFINRINQKWVHGSMECCCCYHPHHPNCQSYQNNHPSKYAQYHYRYHVNHCDCPKDHLMIHSCKSKKDMLREPLEVLDEYSEFKEFYYCCCTGYELNYYPLPKKNSQFNPLYIINQEKDRHSLKYKYKFEKASLNEEENRIQICDGKMKGDVGENLQKALQYMEENSLIGNSTVIANLMEIFAQFNGQNFVICNLYGSPRTGRKTIANHFGYLGIIKQFFSRIVAKTINSLDSLKGIIKMQKQKDNLEGRPLFIFNFSQKLYRQSLNVLEISQKTFGTPVACIIISYQRIGSTDKINYLQPRPFQMSDGLNFVKRYKHLNSTGKKNLQALFKLASTGFDNSHNYKLYSCELNQFQILSIVRKTTFSDYQIFEAALDRVNPASIHYYLFMMSVIKFTTSPGHGDEHSIEREKQKCENLNKFQQFLIRLKQQRRLFYKDYDQNIRLKKLKSQASFSSRGRKQVQYDPEACISELINLQRLQQHYYLIYACSGYRLKDHLIKLIKMFVNYSTLIPCHRFNEDVKIKRETNYLRMKYSPFSNQVYEATNINSNSYLSNQFKQEEKTIYDEYTHYEQGGLQRQQLNCLQQFLKFHAKQLEQGKRIISKKSIQDNYSRPKQKRFTDLSTSQQIHSKDSSEKISVEHHQSNSESTDIPHVYHLAAVMEAGLQYLRSIIGNHFIYSRLKEQTKLQFLKFSILLINNCILLLKNKRFAQIKQDYDIDEDNIYGKREFQSSHHLPRTLNTMRSQDYQLLLPPQSSRTYSGQQIINYQRQFSVIQRSAAKSNESDYQEDLRSTIMQKSDQFLLKELYRLSTYNGLLYLLATLERRCDQINNSQIVKIKISIQLLGIQVRLEQIQLQTQEVKIPHNDKDRHLTRISQIFSQKNYNIVTLKRILQEQYKKQIFIDRTEELTLIKSHIIVALALMSSCYGRFKLVRGDFMIEQIQNFILEWNSSIPFQKRISQQEGGAIEQQYSLRAHKTNPFFAFIRLISENQSVYLHIIESFSSSKFWSQANKNQQLEIYQEMLKLFHLFTLKNTKDKKQFYLKLQSIELKLNQLKKIKHFNNLSTYIHSFWEAFNNFIKTQMNKLAENLILILSADSGTSEHDIKMSISKRLEELPDYKPMESQLFFIKKSFSLANLNRLSKGKYKCNYLCICTSTFKDNEKELFIQGEQGMDVCSQQMIVKHLKEIVYKVMFICLPKQQNLAQLLLSDSKIPKRIIYFNFSYNDFLYFQEKSKDEELIFQKMIMIITISKIIGSIIKGHAQNSKMPLIESFQAIWSTFAFMLVDENNKQLITLSNKQFRKCLFMKGDVFQPRQKPEKLIKVEQKDRIRKSQLDVIKKFTNRFEEKPLQKSIPIDLPSNKQNFMDVLTFIFKEKYSFQQVFRIDLQSLRLSMLIPSAQKGKNGSEPVISLKPFYEKLSKDQILQYIFSNKKMILTLEFREYDKVAEACEKVLEEVMLSLEEEHGNRKKYKFLGSIKADKKTTSQMLIYFFDYHQNSHRELQYKVI